MNGDTLLCRRIFFATSNTRITFDALCFAKKIVILQKYSRIIDEKYTKLLHYRTH